MIKKTKTESGYTLLELVYVLSIISVLICMLVPNLLAQKQRIIQLTAQKRLKVIGSVMTDYALSSESRDYASFQELKDANIISRDLSASNIIIDYSLIVTTTEKDEIGDPALFTIIAIPRPERSSGQLATFAITEDMVVRVYKPGPDVSFSDPHTWDPVL